MRPRWSLGCGLERLVSTARVRATAVKLGPITANFTGPARISREDNRWSGVIIGSGDAGGGGSRGAGEVEYDVRETESDKTTVELRMRALTAGSVRP